MSGQQIDTTNEPRAGSQNDGQNLWEKEGAMAYARFADEYAQSTRVGDRPDLVQTTVAAGNLNNLQIIDMSNGTAVAAGAQIQLEGDLNGNGTLDANEPNNQLAFSGGLDGHGEPQAHGDQGDQRDQGEGVDLGGGGSGGPGPGENDRRGKRQDQLGSRISELASLIGSQSQLGPLINSASADLAALKSALAASGGGDPVLAARVAFGETILGMARGDRLGSDLTHQSQQTQVTASSPEYLDRNKMVDWGNNGPRAHNQFAFNESEFNRAWRQSRGIPIELQSQRQYHA